jgi:hypothetical protein
VSLKRNSQASGVAIRVQLDELIETPPSKTFSDNTQIKIESEIRTHYLISPDGKTATGIWFNPETKEYEVKEFSHYKPKPKPKLEELVDQDLDDVIRNDKNNGDDSSFL